MELGGASRDSSGFGAMEEGLTSRGDRNLRIPLRFRLRPQGSCRVGTESNLDESVKHKVIDAYDTFQYLSLGGWMDKNAPAFTNKVDIADNRMMIYEKTLLGAQNSPLAMSILSRAFYWLLDNGWELDATGKQTTRPSSNYNFDAIQNMHEAERKYAPLQDEIELIVFSYCQRELPALITFFKNDFST